MPDSISNPTPNSIGSSGRESNSKTIKIAVVGASGRMGRALIASLDNRSDARLVSAICRPDNHELLGSDSGLFATGKSNGIKFTGNLAQGAIDCDVVIDFSLAENCAQTALLARKLAASYICGITGLSAESIAIIEGVAQDIPVVRSGNFSRMIAAMCLALEQLGASLPDSDINLIDIHHTKKRDAPSGTAVLLKEFAEANGAAVSVNSLRTGTVIGQHDVIYTLPNEQLWLSHRAENREVFADGAISAGLWSIDQPPGNYTLIDCIRTPR